MEFQLEILLPKEFTFDLANEIITKLYDIIKKNIRSFIDLFYLSEDEDIPEKYFLISEYLAWDIITEKYKLKEETIRKGFIEVGLSFNLVN